MAQYQIPEQFFPGFKQLLSLPPEQIDKIARMFHEMSIVIKAKPSVTFSIAGEKFHQLVIGDRVYEIPKKLEDFSRAIEESQYIYSLPVGWNEGNAKQIAQSLWINAACFLAEYALYLYNHFDFILEIPEINPVPNGTIDLSWRTKNARMLINIRQENSEVLAYYYGDLYHDRFPVKGYVPVNEVTLHFAQWMKDYLAG